MTRGARASVWAGLALTLAMAGCGGAPAPTARGARRAPGPAPLTTTATQATAAARTDPATRPTLIGVGNIPGCIGGSTGGLPALRT